jgi:hypothetical protein
MPSDESDLWRRILDLTSVKEKIREKGFEMTNWETSRNPPFFGFSISKM